FYATDTATAASYTLSLHDALPISGAATRLVITGTGTQTAGTPQSLTITAKDGAGSTVTSYTGDKTLTFSGATASTSPVTAPTVSDRKSTRLNSSHVETSYAVFCLE